jgi:hypothetical protein
MGVDKTRSDHQSAGIDLLSPAPLDLSNSDDAVTCDSHISPREGITRTIHDVATSDH